ncbi:MAG: transcriptional repressor, partial [Proteobacteria bacterium]
MLLTSVPVLPRQQDDDIIVHREEFGEAELKKVIRALNLKVTNQRLAILKCLHEGRVHVTAQELFEKVNKFHPEIGFATVYRFLRTLTKGEFVSEVRLGGLPARYEL